MAFHLKYYVKSIGFTLLVVYAAFALQTSLVYKSFDPSFLIAPTIVGIIFGLLIGTLMDLRHRLRHQTYLFNALVDGSHDLSALQNPDGTFIYVSPSITYFTNLAPAAVYENPLWLEACVHQEDWPHVKHYYEEGTKGNIEFRFVKPDGAFIWVDHSRLPILDDHNRLLGYRFVCQDITRHKEHRDKITQLAHFDQLTELPNRRQLTKNLKTLFSHHEKPFALLFVDLDRFKYINDTFGHSMGDLLLKQIAVRMRSVITDAQGSVYRFGGDEFIVLIKERTDADYLERTAQKMLAVVNRHYMIEGIVMYVGATIGIARYPEDAQDPDTLIKYADLSMYQAKKSKHQQVIFFDAAFAQERQRFYAIENSLRDAMHHEEITLYYQPQFDIQTMQVVGVEALARWFKADGTSIGPDVFIPVAEETGMIVDLGNYVMKEAARLIKKWQGQGRAYKMAINLSPFQLQRTQQYQSIIDYVASLDIPPAMVEFEITEGILLEQSAEQLANLGLFRKAGFGISIDDFGTGFSSLSYLRMMPSNMLKIDRSFTMTLDDDPKNALLVESIIALAHRFEMKVIAEGIETQAQFDLLKSMQCDFVQGFLLAKPMDEKALEMFLGAK